MRIYDKSTISFKELKESFLFYTLWDNLNTPAEGINYMHSIAEHFIREALNSPLIKVQEITTDKEERVMTVNVYDRASIAYRDIKIAYDFTDDVAGVCNDLSEFIVEYNTSLADIDLSKGSPDDPMNQFLLDSGFELDTPLLTAEEEKRRVAANSKKIDGIHAKANSYSEFSLITYGVIV